jgi:hypothetical protein
MFILACDDCHVYIDAGRDVRTVYNDAPVEPFLFDHQEHNLRFLDADCDEAVDYQRMEWTEHGDDSAEYGEWIEK